MIKNKLFGFALLFLSVVSYGQEFVWFENFNDTPFATLPAGWSGFDNDGNTIIANLTDQGVTFGQGWEAINFGLGDTGSNLVSSSAFEDGTGTADDWAITPAVDIEVAGMTLVWEGAIQSAGGYEVYVSTTGNNLSDFTSLSPSAVISESLLGPEDVLFPHTLDLSEFEGETVRFAFRNNNPVDLATFGLLFLDNIGVLAAPSAIDAGVTSRPELEYGYLAIDQAQPLTAASAGSVSNFGTDMLTNVVLQLTVDTLDANLVATNVFTGTSDALATLMPGMSADLTVNSAFTPDDEDALYKFTHTVMFDQDGDDAFEDNQSGRSTYMLMTPNFTSRSAVFVDPANDVPIDPEIDDFSIFFYPSDDGPLSVGQVIEIVSPTAMDSVFVQIQDPTGESYCVLNAFDTASNTIGDEIARTESYMGMGSEGGILQGYSFDCPIDLAPGYYYVGLEDPAGASANFIYVNYYNTENRQFLEEPNAGITGAWDQAPIIYANFGTGGGAPLTTVDIDADVSSLSVELTGVADGIACDYSWDFGDGNTGSGATTSHSYAEEGTYNVCVTVSNTIGEEATTCMDVVAECNLLVSVDEATPTTIEVEVENAVGDVTFSWDNGQNTNPAVNLQENEEYTVTVTDAAGCESTLTASTVVCALSLDLSVITPTSVSAIVGGNSGGFEFFWTNNDTGEQFTSTSSFEDQLSAGLWTVIAVDDAGCNAQENILLTGTGIDNPGELAFLEIAPNPTNGLVTLSLSQELSEDVTLTIYDATGKASIVRTYEASNSLTEQVDIRELANGVYFFQITNGENTVGRRIVLSK